jgi:ATP-dependent HslUV protease subunit HslV
MVAMAGDGQVSMGPTVVKGNARKIRRIGDGILVGFAGSTADALTLLERLEKKLDECVFDLTPTFRSTMIMKIFSPSLLMLN